MSKFDPYLKWLGIRDPERPPNHYRLLGLDLYEADVDVISNAADRQMAHVRSFQNGPHGAISQGLLNELARARKVLLSGEHKQAYDVQLQTRLSQALAANDVPIISAEPIQPQTGNPPAIPPAAGPVPQIRPMENIGATSQQSFSPTIATGGPAGRQANASGPRVKPMAGPKKKSIWFDIAGWLGGGVGAVVIGYLIVNSSWFPGNQPDDQTTVADNTDNSSGDTENDSSNVPNLGGKKNNQNVVNDQRNNDQRNNDQRNNDQRNNDRDDRTGIPSARPRTDGDNISRNQDASNSNSNPEKNGSTGNTNNQTAGNSKSPDGGRTDGLGLNNSNSVDSNSINANATNPEANNSLPPSAPPVAKAKVEAPAAGRTSAARKSLRDLFASGFAKSASLTQRQNLAKTLLENGLLDTETSEMRFAMLDEAMDLATGIGDAETAVNALSAMDQAFKIDFWKRAEQTITSASRKTVERPQLRSMATALQTLIDRAMEEDNFSDAMTFASKAALMAKKIGEPQAQATYVKLKARLKSMDKIARSSTKAQATLEADPNDKNANEDRGNYLVFIKEDYENGMKHWSLANSKPKKNIAKLETGLDQTDGDQLLELADLWYDLGADRKDFEDQQSSLRAFELYGDARQKLQGLNRRKAEMRSDELRTVLGRELINKRTEELAEKRAQAKTTSNPTITNPNTTTDNANASELDEKAERTFKTVIRRGLPEFLDYHDKWDKNQSGGLSRREMPSVLRKMLDLYDSNGDNELSKNEIRQFFRERGGNR